MATAGAIVVLVPRVRQRFDLYRTASTDPTGRFHFDRIPPGDYVAFAWDEVSEGAWQDQAFLGAYENRGAPLRVTDGTKTDVRLVLIR
jgi:hypothetical protein